jgi:hypothetical protein
VEIAQYESLPGWHWGTSGTSATKGVNFLTYIEAQTTAQSAGIKKWAQYVAWRKQHINMPSEPHVQYKDSGWSGWSDFLGTVNPFRSKEFLSFTEARVLVRGKGFRSKDKFYAWERPETIPSQPHVTYKDTGWAGWGDFLGTGNCNFLSFTKARALVQAQGIRSTYAFRKANLEGVPSVPAETYADKGWVSWSDWFGLSNEERSISEKRSAKIKVGLENHKTARKGADNGSHNARIGVRES